MPDNYFARYLPLLIHFVLASLLAGAIVVLSWVIGYRKPTRAKLSPYECGMTPVGDARERFSVKFYLVAMLFILFDVETVFLYPLSVINSYIHSNFIREACVVLRDYPECPFNFLSDVSCVDWLPQEPRFEVVYHLLSISKKERVRLKVRLHGRSPALDSVTSIWPAANYFEREVYDLFGVRFTGHPYLRRLLMPEDWEGYPLRKDYPVEGYR